MTLRLGAADQPTARELTSFADNIGRIRINNSDLVASGGHYLNA